VEQFDEKWEDGAPEADIELNSDPEELYSDPEELWSDPEELWRSLIADEEYPRYWSESVWSHHAKAVSEFGALLFTDRDAEAELTNELRLSELWGRCDSGCLEMDEFFELSALITQVQGLPGSLCLDCDMLGRPNTSPNWALATTTLCRAHMRFRLGHARIDGGTGRQ